MQQAPQLFAAYVGTGQMADFHAGALIQYRLILDKARHNHAAALMAAYPKEGPDVMAGAKFSHPRLWPYVVQADLPRTAATLGTAIQGQGDVMAATPQAVHYFQVVKAPFKKLVVIPRAGHFALITAPDAFREALVKKVRPVAIARGA